MFCFFSLAAIEKLITKGTLTDLDIVNSIAVASIQRERDVFLFCVNENPPKVGTVRYQ